MLLLIEARRALRRLSWAWVAVLVLTSAGSAALFSIVDPLLLAPLPFPRAEQLITISPSLDLSRRLKARELAREATAVRQSPLLDGWSYVRPGFSDELDAGADAMDVRHYVVAAGFFETLGVRPLRGRGLVAADAALRPRPVVVRERLAARLEDGRPLLERAISIGGATVRVVGVVADAEAFPADATVWSAVRPAESEGAVPTVARMRPGVPLEQLARQFPGLTVTSIEEAIRPRQQLTLWLVLGLAIGIALIGGLQLAALSLTRVSGRSRELAIRAACGASRRRLYAELTTDAAVHALLAVTGVVFAVPIVAAAAGQIVGAGFPAWNIDAPGPRAYAYACLATLGAASASHIATLSALDVGGGRLASLRSGAAGSRSMAGTRRWLLFAQVAMTACVLYGTALSVQSFRKITAVPLGFEPRGAFGFPLRGPEGGDLSARIAHKARLESAMARLRSVPAITHVTRAYRRPLQAGALKGTAQVPFRAECTPRTVRTNYVDSHYFRTLSIAVVDGRAMLPGENAAVIDRRLARELAACGAGVGDFLQVTSHRLPIVGVVSDVADSLGGLPAEPAVYLPDVFGMADTVIIRTAAAEAALPAARDILAADTGRAAPSVFALIDDWRRHAAPSLTRLGLLVTIAGLSALLALVGVWGSVLQLARLRQREVAVRLALGGRPWAISRRLVASVVGTVAGGTMAGAAAGAAVSRVAASQWSGAQWLDTSVAAVVPLAFATMALLAAAVPVTRAVRSAPMRLLRDD